MENLVPRESYNRDEAGIWRRTAVIGGLSAGILTGMWVFLFLGFRMDLELIRRIWLSLGMVLYSGLSFGILFPIFFKRRITSLRNAIYNGDPNIVNLPPTTRDYSYRLPCGWMKTDNFVVGGILYIGKSGLMFVPHKKNLKRHQIPFEISTLNDLTITLSEQKPSKFVGKLRKLFVKNPQPLIEIVWPQGSVKLSVPIPKETITEIKARTLWLQHW